MNGLPTFAAALTFALPAMAQGTILGAVDPAAPIVGEALADTDGDGRAELVLVAANGQLLRFSLDAASGANATTMLARGTLQLQDPTHSLLAFADLDPSPGVELVVADGTGTSWLPWPATDGSPPAPRALVRRARCTLRTDQPQLRPFVQDLDHDGRLDLLLPTLQGVLPFVQEPPQADGAPRFRALPLLAVPVGTDVDAGGPDLDDEYEGELRVPQIETADLNGDGRPDLLTRDGQRHAFHLQGGDSGFRAPIEVDLAQFVDSTPKAAVAPGATFVLGDRQLLQRGDIDGDGIPDFVIAHRRKLWTFLASKDGPQFTKARTQAVADDTSGMLVVDLDEDRRADLLTFQVQVPSVGALLLGMVQSIDLDIRAVGYRSGDTGFVGTPAWRRTITLRIPSLLSLLSRQEELVQRFVDIVGKAQLSARGSFTAAAAPELVLVRAAGKALDCCTTTNAPRDLGSAAGRRLLRELLFEDPNPVFDLERLFGLLAGLVAQQQDQTVTAPTPLASATLRDPLQWRPVRLLCGELDARPGQEVVVVYAAVADERRRAVEVVQFVAPSR